MKNGNSKIKYIWDQETGGSGPEGYHFGVEYNNTQINSAIQSENPYDIIPKQDIVRPWDIFSFGCLSERWMRKPQAPLQRLILLQ